ncbi:MAG TPA: sigma-70 family RNA polymerase sigma factor [Thermodesulfobacteriota bacterium]|nr:sigma-70 family RNA polymerase sigma factor [Thermodesulfobacteriota bacterium]
MEKLQKRRTSAEKITRLLNDIRENKSNAINRFLKEAQQTVLSFGMKVCGGHVQDAEDTMQEVLVRFFQGARKLKFNDTKVLRVWLYKVAKNACLMNRRKGKYEPRYMSSINELLPRNENGEVQTLDIPDWSRIPDKLILEKENHHIIQKALLELPLDYRLVLVLRDMEGLSTKEVSEIVGISETNVKVRLHRARLFMRNELSKYLNPIYEKGERVEEEKGAKL